MINRVFSRDFCSGMVLFTCRILIGNISRVTFTSSFQIVFPRSLWFHATECCVFRFKSVPTWWLCGPIGACAARLSPARIFENLSEFTSASWQPSFFTFKTILTMADGDPDFITPVCGFVDACFAKKKAIYELQMKLWYSQKCSHISVQPQSTPAFCGAPTASRQMGTHCGGVANDCRWLCPTYTRGCLYMWTLKCFNYLLTNVNCHQASYWILIL